jgi:hypothetical protein
MIGHSYCSTSRTFRTVHFSSICGLAVAAAFVLSATIVAEAAPPKFIPKGWRAEQVQGRRDIIRFVSPDHRAVLTMRDLATGNSDIARQAEDIADRPGETVTYRARKGPWLVVSGYRSDQIFYRRADLACGGTRWHLIEVTYPRSDKRKLDAAVARISHSLGNYRQVCPKDRGGAQAAG